MTRNRKIAAFLVALVVLGGPLTAARAIIGRRHRARPLALAGAVLKETKDPRTQSPIANVEISSPEGLLEKDVKSDFSGTYRLTFHPGVKLGQPVQLTFRHPDFQPLDVTEILTDRLDVVRLTSLHGEVEAKLNEA